MSLTITRTACAVGMAAVVSLGSLPAAAQQTTTDTTRAAYDSMRTSADTARARRVTSSQRIPVRKEASRPDTTTSTGAVARDTMPVADTTMRDTITVDTTMVDTTAVVVPAPPADTAVVAETTVAVVPPPTTTSDVMMGRGMFGNGFYVGIGGGGTVPVGDLRDAYGTGFNVTVPIGWQSLTTPWGVRADLAYNRVKGDVAELDDGTIWSGTLGLTAQWPVGASSTSFYLVGGGGAYHFRDFGELNASGTGITNENVTKFGLNGGAGINFAVGAADIFVEGRYVSVFTDGDNTNYVPIVLGVRFF